MQPKPCENNKTMADEKDKKSEEGKETTEGNVVLAKFKKDQTKEDKHKRWRVVEEAVSAARNAYTGGYSPDSENKKTAPFETVVKDLIEVMQKILDGEVKLGGLGENQGGIELPAETSE